MTTTPTTADNECGTVDDDDCHDDDDVADDDADDANDADEDDADDDVADNDDDANDEMEEEESEHGHGDDECRRRRMRRSWRKEPPACHIACPSRSLPWPSPSGRAAVLRLQFAGR